MDQPRISSPLRAIRFAAGGEIIFPGGTHLTIFLHNTLPYFYIVPPYSIRASFSWGDTLQLTAHSWETVDASGMIDGDDNWQLIDGNYGAIVMMALPLCTMQAMMTLFRMMVNSGN